MRVDLMPHLPEKLDSERYHVCTHFEPEDLAAEVSDMIYLGWVPVGGRQTGTGMRPATGNPQTSYRATVFYQTMYKPEPLVVVDVERTL